MWRCRGCDPRTVRTAGAAPAAAHGPGGGSARPVGHRRVYPHTSLVAILLAPCLLALLLVVLPEFLLIVVLVDAAVAVLAVADLIALPRAGAFSAQRELERVASLGKPHNVQLTVVNHRKRPVHLWIRDDLPESFEAVPHEFVLRMKDRSRAQLKYRLKPTRRSASRWTSCTCASAVAGDSGNATCLVPPSHSYTYIPTWCN